MSLVPYPDQAQFFNERMMGDDFLENLHGEEDGLKRKYVSYEEDLDDSKGDRQNQTASFNKEGSGTNVQVDMKSVSEVTAVDVL